MQCEPKIVNRTKRLTGQLNGVVKMMEEERDCSELLVQLSAIRSGVDKLMSLISTTNLLNTIEDNYDIKLNDLQDEIDLVVKSR